MQPNEIWLGLVTLAVAIIPIVYRAGQKRNEQMALARAQVAASQRQGQELLVNELQAEVRDLRQSRQEDSKLIRELTQQYNELTRQVIQWEAGIRILTNQLIDNDLIP